MKIQSITKLAVILALPLAMAACGGASSSGDKQTQPSSSESTSKDFGGMNSTTNSAFKVLDQVLGGGGKPTSLTIEGENTGGVTQTISGSAPCEPTGSVTYSGTVREDEEGNGDFDLFLEYKACEGVDGGLGLSGSAFEDDTKFEARAGLNGNLEGDGCQLKFDTLELYALETSDQEIETANGSFFVGCGEKDTFSCSFNETNLLDQSAVEAACICTGAGCDASLEIDMSADGGDEVGDDQGEISDDANQTGGQNEDD